MKAETGKPVSHALITSMPLRRYVLIVDAPGDQSARSAEELKELGYQVVQVVDFAAALTAIEHLERLSLVVVNCASNQENHETFLGQVRAQHPDLPVIWLADTYRLVTRFLTHPSDSEARSNLHTLTEGAAKLLHEEFYGNDLVEEVVAAAHRVFAEFGVTTSCSEPYLKSSLTLLSDVNALIGFAGEGLSGHLILSATTDNARALHLLAIPEELEPRYDDMEDLLGEITNRILGAIKRVFEKRSLSFKLRTPAFIRGPQARYRKKGASPSLAVEFTDQHGLLRLEFCVDRLDKEAMAPCTDAAFMQAGQIQFL